MIAEHRRQYEIPPEVSGQSAHLPTVGDGPDQSPRSAFLASCGVTDGKTTYEDHPELMSTSVILYEIGRCRDTGEFGGHDTYSRRFVELLCMPRTLHSGLRGFSMTLLAGSISIQRSSLNYCEWVSPQYPGYGAGAFAVLHPRCGPFVTKSFTRDFCDC
jgi:hypothetical protein